MFNERERVDAYGMFLPHAKIHAKIVCSRAVLFLSPDVSGRNSGKNRDSSG